MNGHVFPFARRGHEEAQRMLPWLANDTLEADERAWLLSHVEACEECRRDLGGMQALRSACRDDAPVAGDVDAGWRRMRSRLAQEAPLRASRPHATPARRWHLPPRWLAAALAAQAMLLLAVGVAWFARSPTPHTYRTLGAAPAAAHVAGNLVIVFDPQVTEGAMRRLLAASGARIVDGPNEAGAYVLAVPPARLGGVRDALRSAPGVVMVEALPGPTESAP